MVIRIVSANQNKVRFYDIDCVTGPLQRVGELEDPTARLGPARGRCTLWHGWGAAASQTCR
jgi:hypothetical protein